MLKVGESASGTSKFLSLHVDVDGLRFFDGIFCAQCLFMSVSADKWQNSELCWLEPLCQDFLHTSSKMYIYSPAEPLKKRAVRWHFRFWSGFWLANVLITLRGYSDTSSFGAHLTWFDTLHMGILKRRRCLRRTILAAGWKKMCF